MAFRPGRGRVTVITAGPGRGIGRGLGKVILLGEHAVVYGHKALAAAIGLDVTAHVTPAREWRLEVPEWGLCTEPRGSSEDHDEGPARAMRMIAEELLGIPLPHHVRAEATLPARAGLGSSSALSVAVARALASLHGRAPSDEEIERAAMQGERVFHGNPSGVDVALATRGGIGVFRRGVGLEPIAAAPFQVAIGLSGVPRDTAARVADVARRRREDQAMADAVLTELGLLAERGAALVEGGRSLDLGPLFNEAQELLASLGLSSPRLEETCALARKAGAAGAKLTGAGGGGAVVAIGAEDQVAEAWREAGIAAWVVRVGGMEALGKACKERGDGSLN
ncbi:MAG: mevalonate kinase [Deltaproteobacteria bacterium]|nr:mevalonate kinase [Deltaproteobacteria bacterium]